MEILILRRIYASPELFQLVATFGVVLVVEDVRRCSFGGLKDKLGPARPGIRGRNRCFRRQGADL